MSSSMIKPAIFVGGMLVGGGAGYLVARGIYQKKADLEVEASRLYFEKKYSDEVDAKEEELKENARIGQEVFEAHIKNEQYAPQGDVFDDPPRWEEREKANAAAPKIQIIRPEPDYIPEHDPDDGPTSTYGYEPEQLEDDDVTVWPRDPREPYIISFDEFNGEKPEWDKHTMTYYEYCNTLADERESIVTDVDDQVGINNLLHFGKGSGNEDIVYIRNWFREVDIEIIRDHRSYAEAVLGIPNTEGKERKGPKIKRMRADD